MLAEAVIDNTVRRWEAEIDKLRAKPARKHTDVQSATSGRQGKLRANFIRRSTSVPPKGEVRSGSHGLVVINDECNQWRNIGDEWPICSHCEYCKLNSLWCSVMR